MGHDPSKVLMGATQSSMRVVTPRKGTVEAGLGVYLKSDNTLSVAAADGGLLGISLGKDLSNAGFTSIVDAGLEVPVLLTSGFTPTIGEQVYLHPTTGAACEDSVQDAVAVNAIYVSGPKTAVKEDGTEVAAGAALIKMQGGL